MTELNADALNAPEPPPGFKKVYLTDLTGGFVYGWVLPDEDAAKIVAYGNARAVF